MQAYQSAPCPYCGATWNPPGAQTCTNCRNQLPAAPPAYAPPGYGPQPGQAQPPQSPQAPFGTQGYPPQPGYPQPPYPGGPPAYPGQPYQQAGQPPYPSGPAQPGQYPNFAGYVPSTAYGNGPYAGAPGYAMPGQEGAAPAGTSLRLFGQSFTVPVALPPVVVQYQQQLAYLALGVVALLIALFGVLPAIASGQIMSAEHTITGAISHQATVDAGFAAFFAPDSGTNDLNASQALLTKQVQSVNNGLALVQSDEHALASEDQTLSILQVVALPSHAAIAAERQRISSALNGLQQADTALTAGSNQGKVFLPLSAAMIDFTKMYAALGKHDLVGAAAPYPDADQKLQDAIAADQLPGVPAAVGKELAAFKDLLDNSENLIQAIQNKNAADVKKYSDAVQADLKSMQLLSNALPADYAKKTYGANQQRYDAAIKALRA